MRIGLLLGLIFLLPFRANAFMASQVVHKRATAAASVTTTPSEGATEGQASSKTAQPGLSGTAITLGTNMLFLGSSSKQEAKLDVVLGYQSGIPLTSFEKGETVSFGTAALELGSRPSPASVSDVAKTLLLTAD